MAALWAASSSTTAAPSAPTAVDPAARAQLQKLIAEYKKPKLTLEERDKAVQAILALGVDGARRLLPDLTRDFKAAEKSYLDKLEDAAPAALKAKWKAGVGAKGVEARVEELRKTVLAISRGSSEPTKDQIVKTCDPAMAELKTLMGVSREEVLAADTPLAAQRAELLKRLEWWRQAAAMIPAAAETTTSRSSSAAPAAPPEAAAFEAELTDSETLAADMATPMLKADRDVLLANRTAAKGIDAKEVKGVLILNLMRVRLGIGALALDPKLCDASRGHSKDMTERKFFSHESPVPGKETPWKRAELAGTTAGAENIYVGSERPENAIEGWWHSPGHHVNMMGGHKRVGLGRFEKHWTQMFGG